MKKKNAAKKQKTIKTKIIALTLTGVVILSGVLVGIMLFFVNSSNQQSSQIASENILDQVKQSVQNNTKAIVSVSEAQYAKEQGQVPDDELFLKILDNIRNTKYSDSGYYFVYQYDGIRLVAPENKAQEGQNLYELQDANGMKMVQEFIKQSKAGGGFIEYLWKNPTSGQNEKKISYVVPLKIAGQEVLVGTGTYLPMIEASNQEYKENLGKITSSLLTVTIPLTAGIAVLIILVTYFNYSKTIIKPIGKLKDMADRIAVGDTDVSIDAAGRDEIGALCKSFQAMTIATKQQAEAGRHIAQGNLDVEVSPRSEKDILGQSLSNVIQTLKNLSVEIGGINEGIQRGDFSKRANEDAFEGEYRAVVSGINRLMHEASSALGKIQKAEIVANKQKQYLTEEFTKINELLLQMTQGRLKIRTNVGATDEDTQEVYDLVSTNAGRVEELSRVISNVNNEITGYLNEIARKNFDIKELSDFNEDYYEISRSINAILTSFNTVFGEISNAAEQVSAGANQVSGGSQMMSQGATQQASAIEQLSSSIAEIAGQTKLNAENAKEANKLASEASSYAASGNQRMQEMLRSMEEINESSGNISKIIKVIDDIAFQTNILALNAAVEAARAGVHGKGFAVVAEEVRNLAAKSADAAKETTVLIEGSIQKVEAGTRIANETADALRGIREEVEKAAKLVANIATASDQQSAGIEQVNHGIGDVSMVVQSNSATAQESAATSEELSGQAELLKEMVSQFRLRNAAYKGVLKKPAQIAESGGQQNSKY